MKAVVLIIKSWKSEEIPSNPINEGAITSGVGSGSADVGGSGGGGGGGGSNGGVRGGCGGNVGSCSCFIDKSRASTSSPFAEVFKLRFRSILL